MKFLHTAALLALALGSLTVRADDHERPANFRHVVCFQFKESTTEDDIQHIVDEFLLLEEKIDTIVDIEWGMTENIEPLNDDFTHCFLVSFENREGLEIYLPHPDHKAFVDIIKPHLEKVFVFDYTPKG